MKTDNRDPIRTYRAPAKLYRAAVEKAKRRGDSLSEVIRRALQAYVDAP